MGRKSKQDANAWLRAGFRALVETGPGALKAEPLARQLETTKGSFYWHFPNVPGFHIAMMAYWEQRAFTDIVAFVEAEPSPTLRLRKLGQIAAQAAGPEYGGQDVEPAIRAWARSDPMVAQAVRRIDDQRLAYLTKLLSEIGLGNPVFARLIYAGLIGLEDLASRDQIDSDGAMATLIDLILTVEHPDTDKVGA